MNNKEVINKVMANVIREHRSSADAILDLTIFDVRRIVEDTIQETKEYIGEKLVQNRKGMLDILVEQGFIDVTTEEELQELVMNALDDL
jgi:hypothetical protein